MDLGALYQELRIHEDLGDGLAQDYLLDTEAQDCIIFTDDGHIFIHTLIHEYGRIDTGHIAAMGVGGGEFHRCDIGEDRF